MGMIETKTANAIRVLSADAIQKAKSGHPDFLQDVLPQLMNYGLII